MNATTKFSSITEAQADGWVTPSQFNRHTRYVKSVDGCRCEIYVQRLGENRGDPYVLACHIWSPFDTLLGTICDHDKIITHTLSIESEALYGKFWPTRFVQAIQLDVLTSLMDQMEEWAESLTAYPYALALDACS